MSANSAASNAAIGAESAPAEPIYDSARRPSPFLDEILGAWRYRDLLVALISRDVTTRYKRSVLGVAWTMLNPLMMMLVLTLVFSNLFRVAVPHYPVYVLSGTLGWNFFAQSSTGAMLQLIWGGHLLNRIYVPRTAFTFSAVGVGLVNLMLSLFPLLLIALLLGAPVGLSLLQLPLAIVLMSVFTAGMGLLLSTLAVAYRDVAEMYQIALSAWYFLTPIAYPESILTPALARLVRYNPMSVLVDLFRTPIHTGAWTGPRQWAVASTISFGTLLLGWWAFTRRAERVVYRV